VSVVRDFVSSLGTYVLEEEQRLDRALYKDANERELIAFASAVGVVIKSAQAQFERAGMARESANREAIRMIAYAVGRFGGLS
jgi:hypothetical protein